MTDQAEKKYVVLKGTDSCFKLKANCSFRPFKNWLNPYLQMVTNSLYAQSHLRHSARVKTQVMLVSMIYLNLDCISRKAFHNKQFSD